MKFGGPLAIIVHYTVQFNLERCKCCVPDMGPNTIFLMLKIIRRRLKSEIIKKIQHIILMNLVDHLLAWSTARYNSIWSVAKALCRTWAPILF